MAIAAVLGIVFLAGFGIGYLARSMVSWRRQANRARMRTY
jgi:hypothetical protein